MNLRRSWNAVVLLTAFGLAACSTTQMVSIESFPPGARILLDDRDTGLTTPAEIEVSTSNDTYMIQFEKRGYNSLAVELNLNTDVDVMGPGEVVGRVLCAPCCLGLTLPGLLTPIEITDEFHPNPLIAKLEPEGQGLRLFVDPVEAEIFVDGRLRRLLDSSFLVMEPGDHEIEISAPGRRSWRRVIYVSARQYSDLDIELEPDGQGFLFEVKTPDVKLFIDDQYRGVLGNGANRIRTEPGAQQIRFTKEGHRDFEAVLIVEADRYRTEPIRLDRTGQGVIVRRPEGVRRDVAPQILIDGVLRGTAFDEGVQLDPGLYLLEVRIPGRKAYSVKVQVEPNGFQHVDVLWDRDL